MQKEQPTKEQALGPGSLPPCGTLPSRPKLARVYVPTQCYDPDYDLDEALCRGTMFPSLYQPEFVVPCVSFRRYVKTYFPPKEGDPQ
ncbi:spore coat associated protein CotJA [Desulfothermobacter acidiphilus]|uniref:spore coat associated protein CotJA n=1 Tax=Desulfothermobacter acidiphilus TaxID=1938353 RepID=UPI003F8C834F